MILIGGKKHIPAWGGWGFILMAFLTLLNPHTARSETFEEPTLAEYTANPIILSASSTPNIMIIIDNSGSMNEVAYGTQGNPVTDEPYVQGLWQADTISSRDWAQELYSNGANYSGGTVLDLGRIQDQNQDTITGIRLQNVDIPQGATIKKAYIEFTGAENDSQSTWLTIHGHKHANSPEFTSGTYYHYKSADYHDISHRDKTNASVTWHPGRWRSNRTSSYDTGIISDDDPYRTGDLKAIVQEIVNQADWDEGHAISFVIGNVYAGSGGRVALANISGSGPRLYIQFEGGGKDYYGYFDSEARYGYKSGTWYSGGYFYRDDDGDWSGNWLNWLTMRKIDVARKVIVGGYAESRNKDGSTVLIGEPAGSSRSYSKNFTCSNCDETPHSGTYNYYCSGGDFTVKSGYSNVATYRIAVKKEETVEPDDFVDGNIAGVMQRVGDNARWGNMWFYYGSGSRSEGGYVSNRVGSSVDTLVADIEDHPADTWTPLAETLYVAMQYFKQEKPDTDLGYSSSAIGSINETNDPFYDNDGNLIDCAKSFVILITDGASTKDAKIPSSLKDYDNDGDKTNCSDSSCTYADGGSDYLDDVALYAHTVDLRQGRYNNLDGKQTLTLYPIYAFGNDENARQLLKDAARNGGFIDLDGDNLPNNEAEYDMNSDGIPDTYYEASDGYNLERKLLSTINDILQDASSGTAVSVLATSSEGDGTLTQAYFRPKVSVTSGSTSTEVKWVGHLHALWVDEKGNMREDTTNSANHPGLVLSQDQIIQFFYNQESGQAGFRRIQVDENGDPEYTDTNNNAEMDEDESYKYTVHTMEELNPIWDAGARLRDRSPDDRNILTWVDRDNDQVVDASEYISFNTSNAATIGPFLGVKDTTTWSYMGTTASARRSNLINFIRGHGSGFSGETNMRFRSIEGQVWKLGDIINSTPVTVGAPSEGYGLIYSDQSYSTFLKAYKNREQVVYVGANDGMLHAFYMGQYNTGNDTATDNKEKAYFTKPATSKETFGDELWAYIPQALLPHLKWLANPYYDHVYYVDLQPRVLDAKIFTGDADHTEGWGTVLIGGLNLGGRTIRVRDDFQEGTDSIRTFSSSYFAIDITNPRQPELLWERTFDHLGLTVNRPTVNKVGDQWYLLLGSGPTDYDGDSDQKAHIYVLDLKTGETLRDFETTQDDSLMSSPVSVDFGLNYNTDVAYFGMSRNTAQGMKGAVYRLYVPKTTGNWREPKKTDVYDPDPVNWDIRSMIMTDGPQTAPTSVSTDSRGNLWIYFGTGRYIADKDKTDKSTQYFYGVKDPVYNASAYTAKSDAFGKSSSQLSLVDTSHIGVYTDKSVEGLNGVSNWSELVKYVRNQDGWVFELGQETENQGERVLNQPTILGGIVYGTSFVPNDDLCGYSGNSNLLGFYYLTGTAYISESFEGGSEEVTVDGETKTKISIKADLGTGRASGVAVHVGTGKGATGYVQQSTGIISDIELTPPLNIKSGLIYWRER